MIIISTGSSQVDRLLGGGIRSGLITEIYGESGSGKTQFCFSLCVNFLKNNQNQTAIFVDTQGTFRPERISQMSPQDKKEDILNRISVYRPLSSKSQLEIAERIKKSSSKLIIFDSLTYLFSNEPQGYRRHLSIRYHLHELALLAVASDRAIVVTNMIRNIVQKEDITTMTSGKYKKPYQSTTTATDYSNIIKKQEFMKTSVSIYSHIKLKLEIINQDQILFNASLVQPRNPRHVLFTITVDGINDVI